MTDREQLTALLMAGAGDCLGKGGALNCTKLADYLLEHGVVLLPCKVGDAVWWVTTIVDENSEEKPNILLGEIASFSMQKEGLWAFCRYVGGLTFWHLVSDIGKEIFLTREEAEKALKEREDNVTC